MKHTPGLWKFKPINDPARPYLRYSIFAVSPDDFSNGYGVNTGSRHTFLAEVRATPSKSETLANAHLFAAAPELLEVLKEILPGETCGEIWGNPDDDSSTFCITFGQLRRARAAIIKAKGE